MRTPSGRRGWPPARSPTFCATARRPSTSRVSRWWYALYRTAAAELHDVQRSVGPIHRLRRCGQPVDVGDGFAALAPRADERPAVEPQRTLLGFGEPARVDQP